MLLAVRIRLEVMNVTADGDMLESIVKQVDTINTDLFQYFSLSTFHFRTFSLSLQDTLSGTLKRSIDKEKKIRVVKDFRRLS